MIYFLGIITGIINGFFTSGAGQILVFYFVFIKKMETHKFRKLSIIIISVSSIISLIAMLFYSKIEIIKAIIIAIISLICGIFGTKVMEKINSNVLNLVSGVLLLVLSLYKLFFS